MHFILVSSPTAVYHTSHFTAMHSFGAAHSGNLRIHDQWYSKYAETMLPCKYARHARGAYNIIRGNVHIQKYAPACV